MDTQPASAPAGTATTPGPSPGQMLKQFRIDGLLGEGGMGRVYHAFDTRLHRMVAIKVLPPELTSDPERKQRFVKEAHAAARISHPSVAQIYDADDQNGLTFIVMELVEGKTVRQLIENRELDLLGAVDIAIQVADGLSKAHELGIVHRDIKPANIMRTADGHVKILDFGLAKLLGATAITTAFDAQHPNPAQYAVTGSNIVMGTPAYMSPEQVRGLPVDARTDIFGVGVLLFEMATGQAPFRRENPMDCLHAAAYEEAPPMNSIRANVPDELQRVVTRCLKKEPADRYPNGRLLMEDLRRVRHETETGVAVRVHWQQRILRLWEEFRSLSRVQHLWYAAGLLALALGIYLFLSKIGLGNVLFYCLVLLFVYRFVRNRPQYAQEHLVKHLSKIPEVRLIVLRDQHVTVVVDSAVPQLYTRINGHLRTCNRISFFGPPMTVSIMPQANPAQLDSLLSGPGVQYVRPDVLGTQTLPSP